MNEVCCPRCHGSVWHVEADPSVKGIKLHCCHCHHTIQLNNLTVPTTKTQPESKDRRDEARRLAVALERQRQRRYT